MKCIYNSASDIGCRDTNEDSLFVDSFLVDDITLCMAVVCDGLGGLQCGEVASSMVTSSISEWFNCLRYRNFKVDLDLLFETFTDEIDSLIFQAHNKLLEYSKANGISLGTTISAVFFMNDRYYTINVGDSRIYKHNQTISQITSDDTNLLLVDGQQKMLLTQCLGGIENISLRVNGGLISTGNGFLLCSDGLYKRMDLDLVNQYFLTITNTQEILYMENALIDDVKSKGEPDNISMVVIKFF